ncbi:MAG: NDMA-dependent alcohol dehydrogenase [Mycobacteriaceae bacterium]|nr:NDMA-dependent alcohol dehydrogenase [Mycobacteriaceae bacterium]
MKTKAAVLWGLNQKWEVDEVQLDDPKYAEVLVKLTASGLCHSDHHLVTGDLPMPFPLIGGHEGAGIVAGVGPGVADLDEGDPVVFSFIPACGRCRPCAQGMSNLCELGAGILSGPQLDGTHRFHARGHDVGQFCMLGTFSEYTVVPASSVLKLDPATPLDKAALLGCGVTTGFGSAVHTGETHVGDTVVVMGVGGVGINAVQGARIAGARTIVALDPVEMKRERSREFGATHVAATVEDARQLVTELTDAAMANVCVLTVDVVEGAYIAQALSLVGKRGRVVMTGMPHPTDMSADIWLFDMLSFEKQLRGSLFGSSNPRDDIFGLLSLYQAGDLKLDELITREYSLDDLNQGYDDLLAGVNLRGLIRY